MSISQWILFTLTLAPVLPPFDGVGFIEERAIQSLQKRGAVFTRDSGGHAVEILHEGFPMLTEADARLLAAMPHLEEIVLEDCQLPDAAFRHFSGLTELRVLCIHSHYERNVSSTITNESLKHIAKLTQLKELFLCNTDVDDAGLPELQSLLGLEYLDLNGTEVSGAGLPHLAPLEALIEINVRETQWERVSSGLPGGVRRPAADEFEMRHGRCRVLY